MKIILLLFSFVFAFSVFSDDVEQIKASILADCDTLDSRLSSIRTNLILIDNDAYVGIAYSRQLYNKIDTYSNLEPRQIQYLKGAADNWMSIDQSISSRATNIVQSVDSLTSIVSSIRTAANSLTSSSTNGTCNCDLSPVIGAIQAFNNQVSRNWQDFFIYFGEYYDDVYMLKSTVESIYSFVDSIDSSVNAINTYLNSQIPQIRTSLDSIDITLHSIDDKLDNIGISSNLTVNVDLTPVITRLDSIISVQDTINGSLSNIQSFIYQFSTNLGDIKDAVSDGFSSVTNILTSISENLFPDHLASYTMPVGNGWYLKYSNNNVYSYGALNTIPSSPTTLGWIGAILREQFYSRGYLASLNNYHHSLREVSFPFVTNTLSFIHRDQTNYFSFFRGEIGVQGVLSDWHSTQVSGSYHDFLTNHYITVVRGGPLSGNQSTKTNWFSRIETLIAALVFTDSVSTNTVDTSSGSQERAQLQNSYGNVNRSASAFSQNFGQTSDSIVSLYRSYFETFDNAAMPSHVVLMRLSDDSSEDIEISFQSDAISSLVEACRVVSTFCWSSVGILLLYKFLVWAARCIVVTCQFIYRVISSVFK